MLEEKANKLYFETVCICDAQVPSFRHACQLHTHLLISDGQICPADSRASWTGSTRDCPPYPSTTVSKTVGECLVRSIMKYEEASV